MSICWGRLRAIFWVGTYYSGVVETVDRSRYLLLWFESYLILNNLNNTQTIVQLYILAGTSATLPASTLVAMREMTLFIEGSDADGTICYIGLTCVYVLFKLRVTSGLIGTVEDLFLIIICLAFS